MGLLARMSLYAHFKLTIFLSNALQMFPFIGWVILPQISAQSTEIKENDIIRTSSQHLTTLAYLINLEHCFGSQTLAHQKETTATWTQTLPSKHHTMHWCLTTHPTILRTQLDGCPNFRWKDSSHGRAVQTVVPAMMQQVYHRVASWSCVGLTSCNLSITHSPSCVWYTFGRKCFHTRIYSLCCSLKLANIHYPENSLGPRQTLPPLSINIFWWSTFVKILSHEYSAIMQCAAIFTLPIYCIANIHIRVCLCTDMHILHMYTIN